MNHPATLVELDRSICEQLEVLERSSPGILRRLVDSFLSRRAHILGEAERHLRTPDLQALRMVAHSLKGSSASLGATVLAARAGEIERGAIRGDIATCERLLADLPALYAGAECALRAWVDR